MRTDRPKFHLWEKYWCKKAERVFIPEWTNWDANAQPLNCVKWHNGMIHKLLISVGLELNPEDGWHHRCTRKPLKKWKYFPLMWSWATHTENRRKKIASFKTGFSEMIAGTVITIPYGSCATETFTIPVNRRNLKYHFIVKYVKWRFCQK